MSETPRMTLREATKEDTQPINMPSPQQGIAIRRSRTVRKTVTPGRLLLSTSSVKASPDGGIVLGPSESAYTSLTTNNGFTDHDYAQPTATASRLPEPHEIPTSPSRLANIRVRRANNGLALLQSPARAGHAARMRQIFEDASHDHISPQLGRNVLYPQLPNISRKASPTREYNRDEQHCAPTSSSIRRPESLCMSISSFRMVQQKPRLNSPHISEQSSESWSDDSGYFIAGSRNRTSSLGVPPKDRVNDWLINISESEKKTPSVEDEIEDPSGNCPSPLAWLPKPIDIDLFNKSPDQPPISACDATLQDPFLDFDSNPRTLSLFKALPSRRFPISSSSKALTTQAQTHCTETVTVRSHPCSTTRSALEDGGVQLSPLSPNVCVERGPRRYHSARTSPIKERLALRYNENEQGGIGLEKEEAEVQGSPLAPCKIGAGTRFQHPRHGARGLGRFGSYLES